MREEMETERQNIENAIEANNMKLTQDKIRRELDRQIDMMNVQCKASGYDLGWNKIDGGCEKTSN